MKGPPRIYSWPEHCGEICREIRGSRSVLKIILKTRNEDFFLEKWIRWYLGILGPEDRIIVLDNMSDSPKVEQVYREFSERLMIVRYAGFVDSAHSPAIFGPLYQAVQNSSMFYALLDTDEFLGLYDGKKVVTDGRILSFLAASDQVSFFPPVFLNNIYSREDCFQFGPDTLLPSLVSGKPLLNSRIMADKLRVAVGHTFDLPLFLFRETPVCFLLFHMTSLNREQRIRTNMRKLVNFGVLTDEHSFRTVLDMDLESVSPQGQSRSYIREIRRLLAIEDEAAYTAEMLTQDHFRLSAQGALTFSPPRMEEVFRSHIGRRVQLLDLIPLKVSADLDRKRRLSSVLKEQGIFAP